MGDEVLVIPGGDTFRIAETFRSEGLQRLGRAIGKGAGYVGICAGAYLPLRSSIHPLCEFNLLESRIANISSRLPKDIAEAEKYSIPYGCSYVFHPARGPIEMKGECDLTAPLYGGPALLPSAQERTVLWFSKLTGETEMLVNRELCKGTLIGRGACIEGRYGNGRVLCIAPHLEHPDYPEANQFLSELLSQFGSGEMSDGHSCGELAYIADLRRIVADLRVQANALGDRSWKSGIKYWEGEKLLFFVDAIRKRIRRIPEDLRIEVPIESLESLRNACAAMKNIDDERSIQTVADHLSNGASIFLNAYFAALRASSTRTGSTA